jgi:hypothetical protein
LIFWYPGIPADPAVAQVSAMAMRKKIFSLSFSGCEKIFEDEKLFDVRDEMDMVTVKRN